MKTIFEIIEKYQLANLQYKKAVDAYGRALRMILDTYPELRIEFDSKIMPEIAMGNLKELNAKMILSEMTKDFTRGLTELAIYAKEPGNN